MKKLMFVAAAAIAGSAFCIESANTVGYTAKTVEAGKFYLIGTQFDKAGTDSAGTVDVNDLIKLSSAIEAGLYDDDFATAPQIQVLSAAGGYNKFFYISDGTDEDDNELGYDCWCDKDGYELDDSAKLALGKGFWFTSPAAGGTITAAGQVTEMASATLSFPANKFTILCNPYPVAVALQSLTTSATPGLYDDDFATAPQIQVLSAAGGYNKYFYISDGTDEDDNELGHNAWCDKDGYELDGTQIDAGAAFWITAPVAGSVTFTL
jgi:hypothetical protein